MVSIKLENVNYSYSNKAKDIQKINIYAKSSETICILGESGSGKSTILNLIAGIYKIISGKIYINDNIVSSATYHLPIEQRSVALVFQDPPIIPNKNTIDNVVFGLKEKKPISSYLKAFRILKLMNIHHLARNFPNTLSVGQKQRISLARAIIQKAQILLLDEPFANLDTITKQKLRTDILPLLHKNNTTCVLVTHDPQEALLIADRIYVLHNGKILQHGLAWQLYKNPKSMLVASFFGECNFLYKKIINNHITTDIGKFKINNNNYTYGILCIRHNAITITKNCNGKILVNYAKCLGDKTLVHFKIKNDYFFTKTKLAIAPNEKIHATFNNKDIFILFQ